MYKVLIPFCDGENGRPYPTNKGGVSYTKGDTYPKGDFKPTEEHIAYLMGKQNKFGKPLIEAVKAPEEPNKE